MTPIKLEDLVGQCWIITVTGFKFQCLSVLSNFPDALKVTNPFRFEWEAIEDSTHPPLQSRGWSPCSNLNAFNQSFKFYQSTQTAQPGATAPTPSCVGGSFAQTQKAHLEVVRCDHAWKKYEGFMNTYDYCEKCDVKKENA